MPLSRAGREGGTLAKIHESGDLSGASLVLTPFAMEEAGFMRWTSGLLVATMLFVVGEAHAQAVRTLDPVVVTATKVETPQERLGAAVTVDRKSVVEGKSVDLGGRRLIKK